MITIWKTPIVATVEQVLKDLKLQLYGAGLLREIKNTGSDLMCTCPFHANGKEHNPSCGVLLQQKVTKDKTYEAGTVHCYTCGYTADLPQFVADLLGLSSPVEGFKWLVNQYNYQTEERELPDLDMYRGSTAKSSVLEESLVKQYTQNLLQSEEACRYLHKRRIANWVLEAYELGFDPEDKTVLFPVRGMDGKVIFYKGRSIAGKHFYNAKEVDKTSVVFGLWEILNGSFSWGTSDQIEEVWITESEIDALSLISYGVPAVAIMGSKVYGVPYEDCREFYPDGTVNAEGKHRRTTMKSVLLGIMYERGAKAIGEQFDRSAEWAQKLIDDFYKSFPKIQQLRLKVEKMAEEYGYVTTIQGRKRRLPEMQLPDHDDYRYQEAHRQSLNAVIQGSSADIMKLAMIAIYNDPQYKALDCHMVITVHDELIMEVPEDHIKEGADLLVNTMKRVGHSLIDLPMSVDAEVNDYWYGENLADEYLEEE